MIICKEDTIGIHLISVLFFQQSFQPLDIFAKIEHCIIYSSLIRKHKFILSKACRSSKILCLVLQFNVILFILIFEEYIYMFPYSVFLKCIWILNYNPLCSQLLCLPGKRKLEICFRKIGLVFKSLDILFHLLDNTLNHYNILLFKLFSPSTKSSTNKMNFILLNPPCR